MLPKARAAALAVIVLETNLVVSSVVVTTLVGDYRSVERARSLSLVGVTNADSGDGRGTVLIRLALEMDLELERALGEDEGKPIDRISTPGLDTDRRVDIRPHLDI
jgi:hypothetical protein